jgi:hypothetical protein
LNTTTRVTRSALLAALALSLATATATASAHRAPSPTRAVYGDLVDVQVLVGGGTAPLYLAPSRSDRHYVQALRGRNYALQVHNRTGRRVGVLIAVDGLNVVNGERSHLRPDEAMYVLDPYETATIRGWRTSLEQVRRFVFVDEERSYAERTGQANGDMGWIRVLAFAERRPVSWLSPERLFRNSPPPCQGQDSREREEAAPRAQASTPEALPAPTAERRAAQKSMAGALDAAPRAESYPGTGWGERRADPVQETSFVADGPARDHLVFRYEYAGALRALGIDLGGDRLMGRERGELGFAQPPRW